MRKGYAALLLIGIACAPQHREPTTAKVREVSLRCPVSGYIYSPGDTVPITADARGFENPVVEFEVNGTIIARDTSPPFETMLVIRKGERGSKRLVAMATDLDGGAARSAPIDMSIGPPDLMQQEMTDSDVLVADDPWQGQQPTVTLQAPKRGSVFCRSSSLQLIANVRAMAAPVKRVDFEIDGRTIATMTKPPFIHTWSSIAGRHSVTARATDTEGRVGVAPRVMFLIIEPAASPETLPVNEPQ